MKVLIVVAIRILGFENLVFHFEMRAILIVSFLVLVACFFVPVEGLFNFVELVGFVVVCKLVLCGTFRRQLAFFLLLRSKCLNRKKITVRMD